MATENEDNFLQKLVSSNFIVDREKIKDQLNSSKNVKINIAIIGDRGTGKSSLINAFRDIYPNDPRAAKVGIKETTENQYPYAHPENPNVLIWDLPGCNTDNWPVETYLNDIKIIRPQHIEGFTEHIQKYNITTVDLNSPLNFDCYIICVKDGFKEIDLKLATKIVNISRYYIVITMIDVSISNKETELSREIRHNREEEAKVIVELKTDIRQRLAAHQMPHSERNMFAVSALMKKIFNQNNVLVKIIDNRPFFEFEKLKSQIGDDMDSIKKNCLVLTFKSLNEEGLKQKCDLLRKRIWLSSSLSAVGGLSPVPGTSMLVDTAILIEEVLFFMKTLHLNENNIREYGLIHNVNYDDLKRDVLISDPFFFSIITLKAIQVPTVNAFVGAVSSLSNIALKELTEILFKYLSKYAFAQSVEEALKGAGLTIPIIGSVVAALLGAGISFTTTFLALKNILENFEKNYLKIIQYCNERYYRDSVNR